MTPLTPSQIESWRLVLANTFTRANIDATSDTKIQNIRDVVQHHLDNNYMGQKLTRAVSILL